MSAESELRDVLIGDAGVDGIVGTRVYPLVVPQSGTFPCITYQRISTPRIRDLDGADGMSMPRFQVNCWATTYLAVLALSAAVRAALQDHVSGNIIDSNLEDEDDLSELSIGANIERKFGRMLDFILWYKE